MKYANSLSISLSLIPRMILQAGIVAGSLRVTRSLKFRIRAAPAQTLNMLVISAK